MAGRIDLAARLGTHEQRSAKDVEADIRAELRSHLELATNDNIQAGMDPESARRSAEERFGDFESVFGACRTEKLKDRIMLQRIMLALVLILTIAVIGQAYQTRESQRASAQAMDAMRSDVAAMTQRIEDRFDTALFLGIRERARSEDGRSQSGSPANSTRTLSQQREDFEGLLAELRQRTKYYKPSHSGWAAAQREIAALEDRLRRLDPAAPQTQPTVPEVSVSRTGSYLEVERLTVNLQFSTDAAKRVKFVNRLQELALSWSGHAETTLEPGDVVLAEDALQPSLAFREAVNAEGNLAVPELGFVRVLGLTRGELEAFLQCEFETYFAEVDFQISKEAWAFDVLIEALNDSDVFVRLAAAQALGEIGDPRARRALERASKHDSQDAVRQAAASAASSCQ